MDSDILPNRTPGSGWVTGGLDAQDPAQFEERHLIFLQQLGKVQTDLSVLYFWCFFRNFSIVYLLFSWLNFENR